MGNKLCSFSNRIESHLTGARPAPVHFTSLHSVHSLTGSAPLFKSRHLPVSALSAFEAPATYCTELCFTQSRSTSTVTYVHLCVPNSTRLDSNRMEAIGMGLPDSPPSGMSCEFVSYLISSRLVCCVVDHFGFYYSTVQHSTVQDSALARYCIHVYK